MANLSKEKYIEIFNNLPEDIQDALFSLETADIIQEVGSKNKLNDASISILTGLVGDLLMGLVNETDFQKKIAEEVVSDSNLSHIIAQELIDRIISPKLLRPAFAVETEKEPEAPPPPPKPEPTLEPKPQTQPVAESERPVFTQYKNQDNSSLPSQTRKPQTPPSTETPEKPIQEPDTPYILHKEKEIEPGADVQGGRPYAAPRPIFYKPTFSENSGGFFRQKRAARLDLGEEGIEQTLPKTARTPIQKARIVHYSEFKTDLEPPEQESSSPPKAPQTSLEPEKPEKKDVNPNNVIDLKDLPL